MKDELEPDDRQVIINEESDRDAESVEEPDLVDPQQASDPDEKPTVVAPSVDSLEEPSAGEILVGTQAGSDEAIEIPAEVVPSAQLTEDSDPLEQPSPIQFANATNFDAASPFDADAESSVESFSSPPPFLAKAIADARNDAVFKQQLPQPQETPSSNFEWVGSLKTDRQQVVVVRVSLTEVALQQVAEAALHRAAEFAKEAIGSVDRRLTRLDDQVYRRENQRRALTEHWS